MLPFSVPRFHCNCSFVNAQPPTVYSVILTAALMFILEKIRPCSDVPVFSIRLFSIALFWNMIMKTLSNAYVMMFTCVTLLYMVDVIEITRNEQVILMDVTCNEHVILYVNGR